TIKKIPAEVYALEKAYLRPVHKKIQITSNPSITRAVRKDNTILYESNRYTVPLGTYDGPGKEVGARVTKDKRLIIYEIDSGSILAEHALCLHGKGNLIRNNNHGRDRSKGVQAYIDHVAEQATDAREARRHLEEIHGQMPRYIRDQLQAIEKSITEASAKTVDDALAYCIKHGLYRAADFTNAARHYMEQEQQQAANKPDQCDVKLLTDVDPTKLKAKPE